MTNEEVQAMIRARDRAAQTPPFVRSAFLGCVHRVGAIEFKPMTLGALWLMEEIEHPYVVDDVERELDLVGLTHAAFVCARPDSARDALAVSRRHFESAAREFAKGVPMAQLEEVFATAKAVIERGFKTVPGAGGGRSKEADPIGPEKGSGLGWTLTLLEMALAEYSWPSFCDASGAQGGPVEWVLWKLPLDQLFALYAAATARYGAEIKGPSYAERAMIEARREVERKQAAKKKGRK